MGRSGAAALPHVEAGFGPEPLANAHALAAYREPDLRSAVECRNQSARGPGAVVQRWTSPQVPAPWPEALGRCATANVEPECLRSLCVRGSFDEIEGKAKRNPVIRILQEIG